MTIFQLDPECCIRKVLQNLTLHFDPARLHLFDSKTQMRLG